MKTLPKNYSEIKNGGLYKQRVRCGKPTCRCSRFERHSAHYFFMRRDGKLLKFYVRKSDVESFRRLVTVARLMRSHAREAEQSSTKSLKDMHDFLRRNGSEMRRQREAQNEEG